MEKSKIKIALTITILCGLSSCGNQDMSWGSYTFTHAHVQMYGMNEPTHLKVKKWRSDDGGIELKTENFGNIILGDGTYMLYSSDDCPICGEVEYK